MEDFKELDEFSAYFDDIWMFHLTEEQRCCLWAYDKETRALTPLDDIMPQSEKTESNEPEIWLKSNKHCNWKLRKKVTKIQVATYLDAIMKLIVDCSEANYTGRFLSEDEAIKLMESIEGKLI